MKLFFITGLLVLSSVASAQNCKVEMYDPNDVLVTSIRTADDPQCEKAAVACDNWRAWYYAPANSICYKVPDNGYAIIDYVRFPDYDLFYGYAGSPYTRVPRTPPATTSTPAPTTPTAPVPTADADAIRPIEAGETVIFNGALHMVVSLENNNSMTLKPMTGKKPELVKNVSRQNVAITRGCQAAFCASDSVIVIATATYSAIAGIEFDGQLVTKTIGRPEMMSFDVNPSTLAWTKGCSPEGNGKVCVGNVVLRGRGLYYTVAGIQLDGKVVIENNDGEKKLTVNVDPISLLIVR